MPSLLDAFLSTGTAMDLDSMDATIGEAHITAYPSKRFDDMTSNQLIIQAQISRADSGEGDYSTQIQKLIKRAVGIANDVAEGKAFADVHVEGADKLRQQASARVAGMEKDDSSWRTGIALDACSALLGLLVRPHLDKAGRLHSQVSPTLTSTEDVVTHARRIVSLYILISSSTDGVTPVTNNNVCIKIPSHVAGLRACAALEAEGIVTLATACFTVEQGLASSEAKAHYVAPYLNSLEAHFYASDSIAEADKIQPDITPSLCVNHAIQRLFRKRGSKTQVMAASFVDYKEVLMLSGLDRVTAMPPLLPVLREKELDEEHKALIDKAVQSVTDGAKVSQLQEELEKRALDAEERSKGAGWLEEGSEANKALVSALEEDRARRMLADALKRFGAAEAWLRQRLAKEF